MGQMRKSAGNGRQLQNESAEENVMSENERKQVRKKRRRRLRIGALLLLVLLAAVLAGAAAFGIRMSQRAKEEKDLYDSLIPESGTEPITLSYGSDAGNLFGKDVKVSGMVDTSKTGTYELQIELSGVTSFGKTVSRTYPVTVTVIDETIPEITLKEESIEVRDGTMDDLLANVEAVTDGKDGELTRAETETPGCYTVQTDADLHTAGEYTAVVAALDLDGNRAERSFRLTVNPITESMFPYRIRINRELNTVTVYSPDKDGTYSVPVKAMVCSTGAATPAGVFHTFNRSQWRSLFGGVYGQYVTDIVGDILFHSVPYYSMDKGNLEYLEYNKLGTAASLGCIRLAVKDALWIYENCPIGTEVEIYDDPENPGPLGKPESVYIDPESENRGWDPTDPDPANPWIS